VLLVAGGVARRWWSSSNGGIAEQLGKEPVEREKGNVKT